MLNIDALEEFRREDHFVVVERPTNHCEIRRSADMDKENGLSKGL